MVHLGSIVVSHPDIPRMKDVYGKTRKVGAVMQGVLGMPLATATKAQQQAPGPWTVDHEVDRG